MRATENEKRDWSLIALILLLGLLAILFAGRWALRFTPHWELGVNVESKIDPNRDFLTRRPEGFIEPIDPAILTNPAWINNFLTPGASFSTATAFPTTANTSFITSTSGTSLTTQTASPAVTTTVLATSTILVNPTNTFVYFPPSPSATPRPNPVSTSIVPSPTPSSTGVVSSSATPTTTSPSAASLTPSPTFTATATATPSHTATTTATATPTAISLTPADTPTPTFTLTPTSTFTNTPTVTMLPFCTTTIVIAGTSGSYATPSGSTCFQYTNATFTNGSVFQITSTGVNGMVDGSSCPGEAISNGSTLSYSVAQSGGVMQFRITGTAGTVNINISDWTTYPVCP